MCNTIITVVLHRCPWPTHFFSRCKKRWIFGTDPQQRSHHETDIQYSNENRDAKIWNRNRQSHCNRDACENKPTFFFGTPVSHPQEDKTLWAVPCVFVVGVSYQQDRVEARLSLPLLELLLCGLQQRRVLAGGLGQGVQHHRAGAVYIHNCQDKNSTRRGGREGRWEEEKAQQGRKEGRQDH